MGASQLEYLSPVVTSWQQLLLQKLGILHQLSSVAADAERQNASLIQTRKLYIFSRKYFHAV